MPIVFAMRQPRRACLRPSPRKRAGRPERHVLRPSLRDREELTRRDERAATMMPMVFCVVSAVAERIERSETS